MEADACVSSPCLNFGSCSTIPGDYVCECEQGYTGKDCEVIGLAHLYHFDTHVVQIDIDECETHNCENNATCFDLSFTDYDAASSLLYYCECEDGYQGKELDRVECITDEVFLGEYCEENINDCQNHGCENGGQCIDGLGTFSCICAPGFM